MGEVEGGRDGGWVGVEGRGDGGGLSWLVLADEISEFLLKVEGGSEVAGENGAKVNVIGRR